MRDISILYGLIESRSYACFCWVFQDCCGWSFIGECERNPFYMKLNCAAACGTCGCKGMILLVVVCRKNFRLGWVLSFTWPCYKHVWDHIRPSYIYQLKLVWDVLNIRRSKTMYVLRALEFGRTACYFWISFWMVLACLGISSCTYWGVPYIMSYFIRRASNLLWAFSCYYFHVAGKICHYETLHFSWASYIRSWVRGRPAIFNLSN